MKELIFAWKVVELASSLGIISKSVVRSVNPQTYTLACFYSPQEVNSHKVAGKHINMCGSLNCSYYRRITGNRAGGTMGLTASVGTAAACFGAFLAAPVTGGASILAMSVICGTTTTAIGLGGTALTLNGMTETLNGIENELKLKWKSEKKSKEINKLEKELAEAKQKLTDSEKKKNEYWNKWWNAKTFAEYWWDEYQKEKAKAKELKEEIKELESKLNNNSRRL